MHEKFTFGVLQSSGTGHENNYHSGFIEMGIDTKCALIVLIDDHSFKLPVTCTGEDREIFHSKPMQLCPITGSCVLAVGCLLSCTVLGSCTEIQTMFLLCRSSGEIKLCFGSL